MNDLPASDLTREHVGHNVTLHRPTGDVEAVLLGVTHAQNSTSLLVSEFVPAKRGKGGTYERGYYHDEPDAPLVVTITDPFIEPGATSTASPERSPDYATKINSRFD